MPTNLFLAKQKATAIGLQWFDEDFYLLLIRLCVNIVFITILIRFLYYAKTKRKDYLFTYYLIGTITFFLCFGLTLFGLGEGLLIVSFTGASPWSVLAQGISLLGAMCGPAS